MPGIMDQISQQWASLTPQQQRAITTAAIGAGGGALGGALLGGRKKRLSSGLLGGLLGAAGGGAYGWMANQPDPMVEGPSQGVSAGAATLAPQLPGLGGVTGLPALAALQATMQHMPQMRTNVQIANMFAPSATGTPSVSPTPLGRAGSAVTRAGVGAGVGTAAGAGLGAFINRVYNPRPRVSLARTAGTGGVAGAIAGSGYNLWRSLQGRGE